MVWFFKFWYKYTKISTQKPFLGTRDLTVFDITMLCSTEAQPQPNRAFFSSLSSDSSEKIVIIAHLK